jgi:hypothetical protein
MLADMMKTPSAKLPARATELANSNSNITNQLTLDLIFYRWANEIYGTPSGIANLDSVVSALVSASKDPVVGWAAANLGSRDWTHHAPAPKEDDERLVLLNQARSDLRSARKSRESSPSRSIESLKACNSSLKSLHLRLSCAFVTMCMAEREHKASFKYRDAESHYELAQGEFAAYILHGQVASVLDQLGLLRHELGHYDDEYRTYKASAEEWQKVGRGDLAGRQYVKAGVAVAADRKLDNLALSIMKENGLSISSDYAFKTKSFASHGQLLLDVAKFCTDHGHLAEAQNYLVDAEDMANRADEPLLLGEALKYQASVWRFLAQEQTDEAASVQSEQNAKKCLAKRDTALSKMIQDGQKAAAKLSDPLISAIDRSKLLATAEKGARGCSELGKYEAGIEILKQVSAVYNILNRSNDRIRITMDLADYYDAQEEHQAAFTARGEAAKLAAGDLAKGTGERSLVLDILRKIEKTRSDLGDTQNAMEALREMVALSQESDALIRAEAMEELGSLLATLDQTAEAIRDLENAAQTYASELGEPWKQAEALFTLAEVQSGAGKTEDAVRSLTMAIQRVEEWFDAESVDPNSDRERAEIVRDLYLSLIGLQISEGNNDEAVQWLQKARQKYTWIGKLREYLTASGNETAIKVLRQLDQTPGSTQPDPPVQGVMRKVASGWHAVVAQFSPRLSRTSRRSDRPELVDVAEVARIRQRLPENLAIIEYLISESGVYALLLTKTSATCWELPATSKKIQDSVGELRIAVSDLENRISSGSRIAPVKSWSDPSIRPMFDPLYSLQGLLLEDLLGQISKMKPKINTLVFSVPEDLAGVPFQAMPRDKVGKVSFLIQDYAVAYVTPGTLHGFARATSVPVTIGKGRVAIFAGSATGLTGVKDETRRIRDIYGPNNSKYYTGANATAERFEAASSWSNIVHIATHHKLDPDPSQFSIVLSGAPGGSGTIKLANMTRITNEKLELAVLSACETIASSDAIPAAPYTPDIFALAGFPSVIGGLWKVSDDASRVLMENFYQRLSKPGQKAQALQQAQVAMIQSKNGEYAHPFYWASFALYGDPR